MLIWPVTYSCSELEASLYIKRAKVSVRSSVTLGVTSSVANDNDVIMRISGLRIANGASRASDVIMRMTSQ